MYVTATVVRCLRRVSFTIHSRCACRSNRLTRPNWHSTNICHFWHLCFIHIFTLTTLPLSLLPFWQRLPTLSAVGCLFRKTCQTGSCRREAPRQRDATGDGWLQTAVSQPVMREFAESWFAGRAFLDGSFEAQTLLVAGSKPLEPVSRPRPCSLYSNLLTSLKGTATSSSPALLPSTVPTASICVIHGSFCLLDPQLVKHSVALIP